MDQRASVLVVDDNASLLDTFSLILRRKGFNVDTAGDGLAALDKFKNHRFDIILMDIIMPKMDGVEAFRRIREINPLAKVILMTAYSEEDHIKAAVAEGAYSAMYKPVDIGRLINLILEATAGPMIMVVDDDDDFRRTLARALELKGYHVQTAESGEKSLQIARENKCQLALVDIKMPAMDGRETYSRLKMISPSLRTVMMTAYRDEAAKVASDDTIRFLYKPFDPDQVIAIVRSICER